jgi:hypothetical protein
MLRAGCVLASILFVLAISASACLCQEVSIRLSSQTYDAGDTVYFSIASEALEPVSFALNPIYSIADSTGLVIYPDDRDETYVVWEPGRSETFEWPQTAGGARVPLGKYFISVEYRLDGAGPALTSTATFRILTTGCTVDCTTSWGHIKSLYR